MDYSFAEKSRQELLKHTGRIDQIAGIRRSVLDDGKARGLRVADVTNGGGLNYTVLLDRGMDLGAASYRGMPLAYSTAVGYANPAYFEHKGLQWLRNWPGGLLTGCGLRNVGGPREDGGEEFALHGRISNTPAEEIVTSGEWVDGKYVLTVSGKVSQSMMFFENLELTRTITSVMGEAAITVEDRIENLSCRPSHLMLLYHINLGYPLLGPDATVNAPEHDVKPRDETAAAGIGEWMKCQPPTLGYGEQCFYHDLPSDSDGMAAVTLSNPAAGLELEVAYRKAELPFLTQWKQMGEREYVMGLEPANCHPEGVAAERDKFNSLKTIEPGEVVNTKVIFSIKEI